MIERLQRILDNMGYQLGAPELLDVLWLARTMSQAASADSQPSSEAPAAEVEPSRETALSQGGASDLIAMAALGTAPPTREAVAKSGRRPRPHTLFTPDGVPGAAGGVPARAIRAPAPRALSGTHALARALRPLRDHRDHRHRKVVDIEATVRLTAESGILDVMDRPEQELRHTAVLLVDNTPSMRLWQPLVREIRGLLERGGVFHSVQVHRIDPRSGRRPPSVPRTESPITFLLSDGVDEAWRTDWARQFFAAWEHNGPLVVLPPLPRRLWRGTAFETRPQLLVAHNLFAPLGELSAFDPLDGLPVERAGSTLPLPVAALTPASLNTWARMLTRPGASHLMETALTAARLPAPVGQDASEPSRSPERLLERFRASFSPDAYRLAVRLSIIHPLSMPVIQLVRIATLPATTSAVVAEVLLGGLLQEVDEHDSPGHQLADAAVGHGSMRYDFRPGVRDLLASGLSTEQSLDILDAVGEALKPYLGRMPDFAALLADPRGDARLSSGSTAFAVLASPVLDRLYGPTGTVTEGPAADTAPALPIKLRFTLFGPVLAWAGDEPFSIGDAPHQAVLATLLARAGSMVPRSELTYAIRASGTPYRVTELLDACISQLRQRLIDSGPTIVAVQDGYILHPQEPSAVIEVDLAESERLHEAARAAQASGDLDTARRLMHDALSGCDAPPLAGLPDEYAPALRTRLTEWRLLLLESLVQLDLALRPPSDVIAELTALVNEYPIHEPFRALLMAAYYRGGRRDKALNLHSETTHFFSARLGKEPSRELQQLRERILAGVRPEDVLASPQQLLETRPGRPPLPISNGPEQWSPEESMALRFSVLGPVRAWRGAQALPTGSPQQRALLAALLLREGRTATPGDLIDALWGDDPPSQALAAVRTYASRLRKILSPDVLVSESGGYAIRLSSASGQDDPGGLGRSLDLALAQELAADAEKAKTAGDLSRARAQLNKALSLWDGEALASVPGPYADTQRTRLEEWKLQLTESRLDMDLEQGFHAEAVSELTALTAAHPLRKRLRELLMLALYRSGRQAEALAAYADTRPLLADELGVDPSHDLQALHQRILQTAPTLAEPSTPQTPEDPVTPTQEQQLRFSVLGPVRAWRGTQALPTGSPQQRALLAALLLREGRTATAGELIDALWGDDPPSQALAAVRTYASRLRKVLSPGVLVSESGGYAIRLSSASGQDDPGGLGGILDLALAQELAADAERAKTAGDLARARALLNKALSLWDGEVLASVPGPYAETQRARLEEWRLQLIESRLDMDLEQGCHAEAISELTALTAAHPLRERLRELLMLALYRSGRQAEALAAYADTRRLLADELGVDPRPGLQELQQRILQTAPTLAEPSAPQTPEAVTAWVPPAQLPASVSDFTGRTSFVSELSEVLAASASEGRVMAVSALAGIGGVGKTTLAVHVAHRARSAFPDGQLYVKLQGAGARAVAPETVLGSFLRALGTADAAIPDSLEERVALYRSTLDGRRILVLLDNARDAAQVRPLLPGIEGCAALVTSRVRMVDLAGAHLVDLDVMSPEEALQLFTKIVGEERVASERESALDVVAACGFLPLAIRIAASRLAARRTWTVSVLAAKLADERRRLDELQAGDLAVKATFELGYGQLEPAQARAFRLLGLADGPDISLAAAAAMLDLPVEETENLLESLVDTSLLESAAAGRYRYHDLVRHYARACAERDEQPPSERAASLSRLLDFYLASAARVYAIERPGDRLVDHLEATRYRDLSFNDGASALDWLYTEAVSLLACVRQSAGTDLLRRAVDLLWAAKDLTESGANSHQYETTARVMCDATRAAGDARAEGRARTILTDVLLVSGRISQAEEEARIAMELSATARDTMTLSFAANSLGLTCLHQEQFASGKPYFEQAIEGYGAIGNRPLEALSLCNLSRVHLGLGNTDKAVEIAQRALETYLEIGQTLRLANGHFTLGIALARAGRHTEALTQFSDALSVFGSHRQRLWEGTTNFRMAEVHLAARRPAQAAQHAEQALALGCIGGDRMQGVVLTLLGRALTMLGQVDRARACWREALNLLELNGGDAQAEEVRALLTPGGRFSKAIRR